MIKRVQDLQRSLLKVSKICRRLNILFTVLLIALWTGGLLITGLSVAALISNKGAGFLPDLTVASLLLLIVLIAVWSASFIVARAIVKDVGLKFSPFTFKHAQRIKYLGVFFIIDAVLNLVIPPTFSAIFNYGITEIGFISASLATYPIFSLDIKGLLGAVICFTLSAVWEYGALLQAESEGLV